ncbi:hypothetical protein SAMN05216262_101124 [Colwellia chukchiensis]|uniref:Uncharacterized protein n=1 Tax=Colwellia chukchiensis TaxID=641665 RepID=A0A1H7GAI7_9GAMM|nr:hypothetical protein [Colwellia chukchiensis]SEK34487.1 hypothetical protein SAMN05216262_101124 [Colwellia chukchiensis]
MRSSDYINYFAEIKTLDISEQEVLLEKARYEVFTNQKLSGKSALYFIVSLLAAMLIAIIPPYIIGFSLIINTIFLGFGILVSQYLSKWLNGRLLYKGLKHVVSSNGI